MKKSKVPYALRAIQWMFPKLESLFPLLAQKLFIKLFFRPFKYPIPDKEMAVAASAESFFIVIGERKIQCYAWGKGRLVLFVHGWAGRATQFAAFFESFTHEGFRVMAFDGPAHGKSDGTTTDVREFAAVIHAIQHHHGPIEAIVSHSFGGAASLYAIQKGLPLKNLITIATPTLEDEILNTYRRVLGASKRTADAFKTYVRKKYNQPFSHFTSSYIIQHVPKDLNILLVHDNADKEVALINPQHLKECYPSAEMFVTEGLGHFRILKDERVVRKCVTFIKSNTS